MGITRIETLRCEICGAERVIDWTETSRQQRNEIVSKWGKRTLIAELREEVSFDRIFSVHINSAFVCPAEKCRRSAVLAAISSANEQMQEELEKLHRENAA